MQLLIGYETGLAVLWDLREKTAEFRYNAPEVRIKRTSLAVATRKYKKHLKNVGPIRHNEPPHANSPGVATVLSHAACASMSTTTTTTTTTRDRGDRYGPMEWAQ